MESVFYGFENIDIIDIMDKNKLKKEMLEAIFIKTGGRLENPEIAEICAEIAVKNCSIPAISDSCSHKKLNKMIQMDFLDVLYTWKVEAEQKLEKLLEEKEQVTKSTEHLDELQNLEIKYAEGIVNRYKTTISSYMAHHNCH